MRDEQREEWEWGRKTKRVKRGKESALKKCVKQAKYTKWNQCSKDEEKLTETFKQIHTHTQHTNIQPRMHSVESQESKKRRQRAKSSSK